MATTSSFSNVNVGPQVFINFRGEELREHLICHLYDALKRVGINVFIDSDENPGQDLKNLFKRIEESEIALAILSSKYTESQWCLDELVKMMECSTKGKGCKNLWVIPIFYNLDISIVKGLEGDFGVNLWNLWKKPGGVRDDRIVKWNAALQEAPNKTALILKESGEETVAKIVITVQNALARISEENPKSQEATPTSKGRFIRLGNRLIQSNSSQTEAHTMDPYLQQYIMENNDTRIRALESDYNVLQSQNEDINRRLEETTRSLEAMRQRFGDF